MWDYPSANTYGFTKEITSTRESQVVGGDFCPLSPSQKFVFRRAEKGSPQSKPMLIGLVGSWYILARGAGRRHSELVNDFG